ncbi:glycoside hydrolase domain-containing protein [Mucilaginibacter sp.]|uniref:glycoside hydrolase domain-containing protein n=1 Tax=Mucilaginibacter sp. TaxID=1882438 RepID=UPI000CB5AF9F|nr:glycoside hydrolase domain-containing protein [Mucilaginibacter sp.]PLW91119.1 MAG: hypothetical protein C0154_02790 [Mucilaginibacter sp.]PMP64794.1 MAG: hypothetical protein C0191_05345 [Mucilaginibacter sp.]HEK19636.1 DUF4091 domain-containing protein [Bacteroidota bacterium]
MIRVRRILAALLLPLIVANCKTVSAQNLALGQTYTVSKNSNYPAVSADNEHTVLTDGVYTTGQFWQSKTTTGWQFVLRVTITIPLKSVANIDKISFNTARGSSAGVNYPAHVFAFTSTDNINYSYQGDVTAGADNKPGDYAIHKFVLNNVRQKAAFVKLVIIPNGSFVFCDEIEVSGGGRAGGEKQNIAVADLDKSVDRMLATSAQIGKLQMGADMDAQSNLNDVLARSSQKWALSQRRSFNKDLVVTKINEWDKINVPFKPQASADNSFKLATAINGDQYRAFMITNLSSRPRVINLSVPAISNARITLYNAGYVLSGKGYDQIADPLIKISDTLSLNSGESKLIFFRINGIRAGTASTSIKVSSAGFATSVPVNVSVSNLTLPERSSLNAVNWAYLNFPMLTDKREAAANDLKEHGINTMVVPPNVLPYVVNNNFTYYRDYLKNLQGFKKLLIYINFPNKNNYNGTQFMSDDWKNKFLTWYQALIQNSKDMNFDESQIYLYPYDEVADKDLDNFVNFLNWIKSEHPSIKVYATVASTSRWQKIGSMLSLVQIRNTPAMLAAVKGTDKEIWMYDIAPFSESLSPYTYYRLMAWKAFANGVKGIGFWNYADYRNNAGNKALLSNFNGTENTNYSVIYIGPDNKIVSTRRWEAFAQGVQDYQLLEKYALKFGAAKARQLAASVADNPDDDSRADQAVAQILLEFK